MKYEVRTYRSAFPEIIASTGVGSKDIVEYRESVGKRSEMRKKMMNLRKLLTSPAITWT